MEECRVICVCVIYNKCMTTIFAEQLLYWIETLGILAFALSGVILARQKDFDIVGVYIIAWVTAFGGGTIRDVVLDIQPVYWIAHAEYPLMLLGLIIVISLLKKFKLSHRGCWCPMPWGWPFCHFNGPNRPSVGAPTHYRGYFVNYCGVVWWCYSRQFMPGHSDDL